MRTGQVAWTLHDTKGPGRLARGSCLAEVRGSRRLVGDEGNGLAAHRYNMSAHCVKRLSATMRGMTRSGACMKQAAERYGATCSSCWLTRRSDSRQRPRLAPARPNCTARRTLDVLEA